MLLYHDFKVVKSINIWDAMHRDIVEVGSGAEIHETVLFSADENAVPVVIGANAVIGANVQISDGISIGPGARISGGSIIQKCCMIGRNTFVGHNVVMRPRTVINSDCVIGHGSVFEGDIVVGSKSLIHAQCHITKGVIMGQGVFIAPLFCGANDPVMAHMRRDKLPSFYSPYVIEDYVRIAIGASVLPGVRIGRNAVVGAHSLVTKNVEENSIVRGVPAKHISFVPEEERL